LGPFLGRMAGPAIGRRGFGAGGPVCGSKKNVLLFRKKTKKIGFSPAVARPCGFLGCRKSKKQPKARARAARKGRLRLGGKRRGDRSERRPQGAVGTPRPGIFGDPQPVSSPNGREKHQPADPGGTKQKGVGKKKSVCGLAEKRGARALLGAQRDVNFTTRG